jgi:hypothetical protein
MAAAFATASAQNVWADQTGQKSCEPSQRWYDSHAQLCRWLGARRVQSGVRLYHGRGKLGNRSILSAVARVNGFYLRLLATL